LNLSQTVISSKIKHAANVFAFTEQGVSTFSSVLKSERAIQVTIAIMRAFVRLKQVLATHKELAEKLEKLEKRMDKRGRSLGNFIIDIAATFDII